MPEAVQHSPADAALIEKLAELKASARHYADPRDAVAALSAALLEWFEAE